MRRAAEALALLLVLLAGALASPPPALAQELEAAGSSERPPDGYELSSDEVTEIARDTPEVVDARAEHSPLDPTAYTHGTGRWQVSFVAGDDEVAQVHVDDGTGAVLEAWTGPQVAWKMARGYEGAFGEKLNAPYVWLPLCAIFLIPFVDPRRPFRMLHLDLLVLLGFGVSHVFFNSGEISWSVPLVYPVLGYLLARMLWVGFRPRERRERLIPLLPATALLLGVLFLVGFRVALNVADSRVIDVGYASVVGADVVADGEGLYDRTFPEDIGSGDTYGPVTYLSYLPFEQALPWSGRWDGLPAAHGAAIAFDVLTILGLFLLGRRLRPGPGGRMLGAALAFGWASYPYTTFVLMSNANDALVAMLLVYALLALASPPARGLLLGLATAAKFAPLVLAPLFARGVDLPGDRPKQVHGGLPAAGANGDGTAPGTREPRRSPFHVHGLRRVRGLAGPALFAVAFGATVVAAAVAFMPDGGLRELYDRTAGYQTGRESPFSVWGQVPSLDWLQTVLMGSVAALGIAVAFVPRRRGPLQVAALGAAVLIALQLAMPHWFYLYIVWFLPLVLVALFARHREPDESSAPTSSAAERPAERVAAAA